MSRKSQNVRTITIGPGTWVSPPYIRCPNCEKDRFGVLGIYDDHYSRRCKDCYYPQGSKDSAIYPLPELNKKIIYIDQMAISNMMKVINPHTKAYKKGAIDKFWLKLFERLDSLSKFQLIVCPDSGFHTDESLLSPYYAPLKRMYELLSHGLSFFDQETIKRNQILEHAQNWISEDANQMISINIETAIHGKINSWQDRLIITVDQKFDPSWIASLRKTREEIQEGLNLVFKQWQSDKDKSFDYWFEEEIMGYGKSILRNYADYLKKYAAMSMGIAEFNAFELIPPSSVVLVHYVHEIFKNAHIKEADLLAMTRKFFTSPSLKNVPVIKIAAMIYAAIARKAASGRKRPPNKGMANDISMISTLLPYCDAMFIDNECRGYLMEKPLCNEINYGTKVFSLNNKEEFMSYLDNMEKNASNEHMEAVHEVYGKDWPRPFTSLYKKGQNSEEE